MSSQRITEWARTWAAPDRNPNNSSNNNNNNSTFISDSSSSGSRNNNDNDSDNDSDSKSNSNRKPNAMTCSCGSRAPPQRSRRPAQQRRKCLPRLQQVFACGSPQQHWRNKASRGKQRAQRGAKRLWRVMLPPAAATSSWSHHLPDASAATGVASATSAAAAQQRATALQPGPRIRTAQPCSPSPLGPTGSVGQELLCRSLLQFPLGQRSVMPRAHSRGRAQTETHVTRPGLRLWSWHSDYVDRHTSVRRQCRPARGPTSRKSHWKKMRKVRHQTP